jgi:uncharacterized membrane-anchored protein
MSANRFELVMDRAIAEGVLPQGAQRTRDEQRPWPVILLTALGAWLAAVPLVLAIFVPFYSILTAGIAPYIVGTLCLAGTTALLRRHDLPLFLEQFTVPGLLAGGVTLGIGLELDLKARAAASVMALVCLAVGVLIRHNWLRLLLGSAASLCMLFGCVADSYRYDPFSAWLGIHLTLAIWLIVQQLTRAHLPNVRSAPMLEWIGMGWVLITLSALAFWAGTTFLVGASIHADAGFSDDGLWIQRMRELAQLCSAALAACAAAWLAYCWPSIRQVWSGLAALVLVGLAWLMPTLGGTLLVLAIFCAGQRWRLAIAAGLAAAWIIGAYYYQLSLPLDMKAMSIGGAGASLAAIAWVGLRNQSLTMPVSARTTSPLPARIGISICVFGVLAVVNIGIWQKETLIAKARSVFVEMAPTDPRSLMQGDFMRLAFRLPHAGNLPADENARVYAVGKINARGILLLERLASETRLAPDEMAIELTRHEGFRTLVTDAWYFKEGEAARWARARYGEFRVDADGHALLVGLRGPSLEAL